MTNITNAMNFKKFINETIKSSFNLYFYPIMFTINLVIAYYEQLIMSYQHDQFMKKLFNDSEELYLHRIQQYTNDAKAQMTKEVDNMLKEVSERYAFRTDSD